MPAPSFAEFLEQDAPDVVIPREVPSQPGIPTIAYRNNNPGNIRVSGSKEYRQYDSPVDGFRDIENNVRSRAKQGHTLASYISKYAPADDDNDTETYIKNAANALGVDRNTPLVKIDPVKLAAFQAKQESGTDVKPKGPPSFADFLASDDATTPSPVGPELHAGHAPGIVERAKEFFLGGPQHGDTPLGRALGYSYEAPTEAHTPTTSLPLVRPTVVAPGTFEEKPGYVPSAAEKAVQGVGRGLANATEGMLTAPNTLMLAGSGGLGLLSKVNTLLPRAVSAAFSADMVHGLYEKSPEFKAAWDSGDPARIAQVATEGGVQAIMATLAATHAVRGEGAPVEAEVPKREASAPVAESAPAPEAKNPSFSEFLSAEPEGPKISGEQYLRAQAAKQPEGQPPAKASAEVFAAAGPTYSELFDRADKLEQRRARTKPEVPETGNPNEREDFARENLAQKLAQTPYKDLNEEDRSAIDDLVLQKYGAAVEPPPEATPVSPPAPTRAEAQSPPATPLPAEAAAASAPPVSPQVAPPAVESGVPTPEVPPVASPVGSVSGPPPEPIAPPENRPEPLAPTTQILERIPNKEDGTEAVIAKTPQGYSVALRDTDANKAVSARIFPTLEQAREHAATVNPPTEPVRKFSSTQVNLPEQAAPIVRSFGAKIPVEETPEKQQRGMFDEEPADITAAKERLKARFTSERGSASPKKIEPSDESVFEDLRNVGAYYVKRGVTQFADWSKSMVEDFGEAIRPMLDKTWGELAAMRGRTEKEPPAAQPSAAGEPEIKPSKLAQGVEEKAIANKLTAGFEGKPEYTVVKVAEQAKAAADLLKADRQRAIDIAMGKSLPPVGLLPESVFVAVENHAIATKNVALLRDLATSSGLSMEATGMGQRIRMLAERDPESPVAAMQTVTKAREDAATRKYGPQPQRKVVTEIRKEIKSAAPKLKDWAAFVDSLKCT